VRAPHAPGGTAPPVCAVSRTAPAFLKTALSGGGGSPPSLCRSAHSLQARRGSIYDASSAHEPAPPPWDILILDSRAWPPASAGSGMASSECGWAVRGGRPSGIRGGLGRQNRTSPTTLVPPKKNRALLASQPPLLPCPRCPFCLLFPLREGVLPLLPLAAILPRSPPCGLSVLFPLLSVLSVLSVSKSFHSIPAPYLLSNSGSTEVEGGFSRRKVSSRRNVV
jgi:hypothetical protein